MVAVHAKRWPLCSLVLTFQVVPLLLGVPFYTAAPKLSYRADHIPATSLLEELQVLERESGAKGRMYKRAAVHGWCLPSEHPESNAWIPKTLFTHLPRVTAWSAASRGAWAHTGHKWCLT